MTLKAKQYKTERDRLALKVEQYQKQLDDRWAGVVGVTNTAVAQLALADALATAVLVRSEPLPAPVVEAARRYREARQ